MGAGWGGSLQDIAAYNASAGHFEHIVAKYCTMLGTSLAGLISFEDRIAIAYLAGRKDVDAARIGCAGLSGGGLRATLLQASCERIRAAVVVGLMSTYEGMLDRNVASHTWMMFPPGWSRHGDWADLAACRAPSPLLVQYNDGDPLFTLRGQKAAHRRIAGHYRSTGKPRNYAGQFYPGAHKFDIPMQEAAFSWLASRLRG
jgi:dienelactone hydrolase